MQESNLIKDGVITEENRRKIFPGALATLAQVHKDFLKGLDARVQAWNHSTKIGDLFLTMIPYFKLYPVYVSDFENQMKALKDAKNNERFWEFIKGGFALLKDPSNDLPSLLITPVQRIPRYLMLVSQLLKYTWPTHRDYANIKSAAEQLGKIAEYVDQKAKDAENVQKMHHVQEVLLGKYETLLDPQRRFVNQGLVFEVRGKDMRMMGLFHFSDLVVWAKVKKIERKVEPKKVDKSAAAAKKKPDMETVLEYHYQSRVPLMNCSLSNADDQSKTIRNCFWLRTPEKNYLISCNDAEAKKQWMSELNESIQQVNVKAATLRKQVAMVEEKKATMRQVREEEKKKPDDKKPPTEEKKPDDKKGRTSAPAVAPAIAPPLLTTLSSSSLPAVGGGKDAKGKEEQPPAKPKRSGWLLKRVKEDKSAAAVVAAEDATPSVEDTQSEEDDSAGGDTKKKGQKEKPEARQSAKGVGMFRGATSRGAATAKSSAEVTSSNVKKLSVDPVSVPAAVVSLPQSGSAPGVAPIIAASAPPSETRKRAGWLARGSRPANTNPKVPDRRASASQAEDAAETTMNLSPGTSALGHHHHQNPATGIMPVPSGIGKDAKLSEDGDRIRRGSRILNLDDLPTLDAKTGDTHMAELKAAFDRLGETPMSVAGQSSPGRRRSLSAPDLLLRSPIKSPAPGGGDSEEDDSEEASGGASTPLRVDPKLMQARPPPSKDEAMAAAAAAAEAKRFKRLKALKRGSMSGMDLNKVGKRPDLKAMLKDLKDGSSSPKSRDLTVDDSGAPTSTVAIANPAAAPSSSDGSRTPPRPGRKAPALNLGAAPVEKPVLRKADNVVLEDSDSDEPGLGPGDISALGAMLKFGGKEVLASSSDFDAASGREGDEESSSDDVGEEQPTGSTQSHFDPMTGQHVMISDSVLTSGDVTPQLVKPGSGEVTPKMVLSSRGENPPPPPEKSLGISTSPEELRSVPDSVEVSPRPPTPKKEESDSAENSFSIAAVPDCVVEEGTDETGLVVPIDTTPMMRAISTVQANANMSTSTEALDESEPEEEHDQEEDSQEASFEP